MPVAPKEFNTKEKRDALGRELVHEFYAGKMALGDLPRRWKKNEAIDKCDPKAIQTDVLEGAETYPMPMWTQRADRIAGTCYRGVTGLDPWAQAIAADENMAEVADKVEHDLQFLITKSGMAPRLYKALRIATNTNIAIIRTRTLTDQGLFEFREGHPQDFVAYPAEFESIADMKTVGTRTEKMASQIRSQMKAGDYFDDCKLVPGDADYDDTGFERAGRDDSFDRTERTAEVDPEDRRCILYDFITTRMVKGQPMTYRGCLCYSSGEILDLEPYDYSVPWYSDLRYDPEYGRFWPAGSPAQRVQGVQIAFTDGVNSILQNGRFNAAPIVWVKGGSLTDVKIKKIQPGDLLELPANAEVGSISLAGNTSETFNLLPLFEKVMDGASRISSIGMGQETQKSTTATEAAGLLEGQQEGEDMYLATIADTLENSTYPLMYEMYKLHFEFFKSRWGEALKIQDPMELEGLDLRFEITGRSGTNNPATIANKLMMLINLAMNPMSGLDYKACVQAIVNALQIPGSAKLFLPEDPAMALQEGIIKALQLGATPDQIMLTVGQVLTQVMTQMQAANGEDQGNTAAVGGDGSLPGEAQAGPPQPAMAGFGANGGSY